jgi:hypothetical protein
MDVRRIVLFGVLCVSLVVALFTSPLTRGLFQRKPAAPAPASGAAGSPGASSQAQAPSAPAEVPKLAQEKLAQWRERFAQAWTRDPFFTAEEEQALRAPKPSQPVLQVASPPAPRPAYTVKAILISDTSKVAAIDGRLISEGEMLGEERVVQIQPDGVVLEQGGQRRRIEMAGGAVPLIEVGPRATAKE